MIQSVLCILEDKSFKPGNFAKLQNELHQRPNFSYMHFTGQLCISAMISGAKKYLTDKSVLTVLHQGRPLNENAGGW